MRLILPNIFDEGRDDERACIGLFERRDRVIADQRADRVLSRVGVLVLVLAVLLVGLLLAGCGGGGDAGAAAQGKTLSATASDAGVTTYDGADPARAAAEAEALARVRALIDESLATGRPITPPPPPTAAN